MAPKSIVRVSRCFVAFGTFQKRACRSKQAERRELARLYESDQSLGTPLGTGAAMTDQRLAMIPLS
jgi:hypothetical protein